jgi:DNA-directed RNA polymerase subunit RPC12/RpoP
MPPRSGGPANPPGPENPPCPTCERRMVIRQVAPVLFTSELDDIIYGCEKCGTEVKRTIKRT